MAYFFNDVTIILCNKKEQQNKDWNYILHYYYINYVNFCNMSFPQDIYLYFFESNEM